MSSCHSCNHCTLNTINLQEVGICAQCWGGICWWWLSCGSGGTRYCAALKETRLASIFHQTSSWQPPTLILHSIALVCSSLSTQRSIKQSRFPFLIGLELLSSCFFIVRFDTMVGGGCGSSSCMVVSSGLEFIVRYDTVVIGIASFFLVANKRLLMPVWGRWL